MSEYKGLPKGGQEKAIQNAIDQTKKSFTKWFLISLIPVVNWVTMGFAVFCYNNLCYLKSGGKSKGNNAIRFLMLLWGFYLFPQIVIKIATKNEKLQKKILGWN